MKPPPPFVPGDSPSAAWELWKEAYGLYADIEELASKPVSLQRSYFLHCIGLEGRELLKTLNITQQGDARTIAVLMDALSLYYRPYKNRTYYRHKFHEITQGTRSVDDFIADLKTKARDCEFDTQEESLIVDRLICGLRSAELREKLLQEANLSLALAIDLSRSYERTKERAKVIGESSELSVEALQKNKQDRIPSKGHQNKKRDPIYQPNASQNRNALNEQFRKPCYKCGSKHRIRECPAFGQRCNNCKRLNHFAKVCKKSKYLHVIEATEPQSPDEEDPLFVGTLTVNSISNDPTIMTADISIEGKQVTCKLDTGSQVNLLPVNIYNSLRKKPKLQDTDVTISAFTGHKVEVLGQCKLWCENKFMSTPVLFYITKANTTALLGAKTVVDMKLITRLDNINTAHPYNDPRGKISPKCQSLLEEYQDVFMGLGELKMVHTIKLKKDAVPYVAAPRMIPLALQDKVQAELDRMESIGVIKKIDEPTEWVHPVVVVSRPNGTVRICMDPRKLNEAILREHYAMPTQETILAKIEAANVFTVLDASDAFWQIRLDEASSKLCTIATPFGRYSFFRMSFGLASAPEVLQKAVQGIIAGVGGCTNFYEDLLIWGIDNAAHDTILEAVLKRARAANFKFNKKKLSVSLSEVKFLGHTISASGIKITQSRIKAIQELSSPNNTSELKKFLGIITYLSRFIPNLSEKTAYLRQLLKNNAIWVWDAQAEKSYQELKQKICRADALQLFEPHKQIVLSADASKYGLGFVMLQDNKPVAYASASLSPTQMRYAQIEKELLAVTTACEKFHYYVYGRPFLIQTNHKPLLAIVKKPLESISPRLQRMLLRLLRYQFQLEYIPGKKLLIADALSRNPIQSETVNTEYLDREDQAVLSVSVIRPQIELKIKNATTKDPELQIVLDYINEGWPYSKTRVKPEVREYWRTCGRKMA